MTCEGYISLIHAVGTWPIRCSTVILNRGPHGPPGGNLQVLGRNTEHLGNWGGTDPFGGINK